MAGVVSLRQAPGDGQEAEDAKAGQDEKERAPVPKGQEPAAQQRRQDGRQTHDQDQQGEDPGRLPHPHAVPHHGAGHHHAGAAPKALQETADDQHCQAVRQGAAQGGEGEEGVTEIEGWLAAKAVAEGAIGQLSQGQADEEGRQGELQGPRRHLQGPLHLGEAGQIHVDGQRRDGGQHAQEEDPDPQLPAAEPGGHGGGRGGDVRSGRGDGHGRDISPSRRLPPGPVRSPYVRHACSVPAPCGSHTGPS